MLRAYDRAAVSFSLSNGNAKDGPEGRKLLSRSPHDKAHACFEKHSGHSALRRILRSAFNGKTKKDF